MNVVTKSGTNGFQRRLVLHAVPATTPINAKTRDRKRPTAARSRTTAATRFGGSFGGPLVRRQAPHFFVAAERTQQDTFQLGQYGGALPEL